MVIWFSNISDNRGVACVGPGNVQNNMNYKWNPKVQMYTHIRIWFTAWDSSFKRQKREYQRSKSTLGHHGDTCISSFDTASLIGQPLLMSE